MALRQEARPAVTNLSPIEPPSSEAPASYVFRSDLVTLHDRRLAEAEAIRTVRTHVIARHLDEGRRGLTVCAPAAASGCSFTATNLAVALSQVGVATLLIDGDMRKPSVESRIQPSSPPQGLRHYLASPDRPIGDFIHTDVLPHLSVMYAGGATEQAQELLGGDSFRDLIDRCLRDFEFTIVDTPPANDSADSLRAVSVVGYALIVARTNVTMLKDLTVLSRQIQENGGRVVGSVVNEL
jgi:protein-tyrosine kinase